MLLRQSIYIYQYIVNTVPVDVAKIPYTLAPADILLNDIQILVREHFLSAVGAFAFLPVPDGLVFLSADFLNISSVLEG